MRRSAAPSQLLKRKGFTPPSFTAPSLKRPCNDNADKNITNGHSGDQQPKLPNTSDSSFGNADTSTSHSGKVRKSSNSKSGKVRTPKKDSGKNQKSNVDSEIVLKKPDTGKEPNPETDTGKVRKPSDILSLIRKKPTNISDPKPEPTPQNALLNSNSSNFSTQHSANPPMDPSSSYPHPFTQNTSYPHPSMHSYTHSSTQNGYGGNVNRSGGYRKPLGPQQGGMGGVGPSRMGPSVCGKDRVYGMENEDPVETKYYSVVWCKRSNKKHKKWEGDAIMIVKKRSVILKDLEGKEIGQGRSYKLSDLQTLVDGSTLPVGAKEVEIQNPISAESYASGRCFQGETMATPATVPAKPSRPQAKPFRLPTTGRPSTLKKGHGSECKPLFDPSNPNALVMPRPPAQQQWQNPGAVVDVVVDPHITSNLRPHQQEGIVFLYECVLGYRSNEAHGCILADEMGLGKTLQCVALVWTLLKQGPFQRRPLVKTVLVVTPSSLTANWGKEFKKWLGSSRITFYIVDQNNKVENYNRQSPVMIISYEMFIRCTPAIKDLKFDLLICDEGHRLKNTNIKTTSLLTSIGCKRRVLLTGTPVQNDLQELYALVEFINPGVLGTSLSFRHVYEEPIVASQQPHATQEELELGANRAAQLNRITSMFILRRTQDVINKYLPAKTEYVVFCLPSPTQVDVYQGVLGSRGLRSCLLSSDGTDTLSALLALRKVCSHPAMLAKVGQDDEGKSELAKEVAAVLPDHLQFGVYEEQDSGKLAVLSCMLWSLWQSETREKIVLVSNYTSTLDVLASLCRRYDYPYLRLDGQTPTHQRQQLVDRFNCATSEDFVFLLSAKAGGVGLNLVGASRILLYDLDWNPATDLQAMARVWRDGQRNKVHIYRLLVAGTVDEKMYQRQIKKQGLSGAVVDARDSHNVRFSTHELKDLFSLHLNTACQTHDLLECACDLQGGPSQASQENAPKEEVRECQLGASANIVPTKTTKSTKPKTTNTTMDQLHNWQHLAPPFTTEILKDPCLEAASDFITFIFTHETRTECTASKEPASPDL